MAVFCSGTERLKLAYVYSVLSNVLVYNIKCVSYINEKDYHYLLLTIRILTKLFLNVFGNDIICFEIKLV